MKYQYIAALLFAAAYAAPVAMVTRDMAEPCDDMTDATPVVDGTDLERRHGGQNGQNGAPAPTAQPNAQNKGNKGGKQAGAQGATNGAGAAPAAGATGKGQNKGQQKGQQGGQTGSTGSTSSTPGAAAAAGESDTQAAQNWMTDTGKVSGFLNQAKTLKGAAFTSAAAVALAAEKDELNHKAILDADPKVKPKVVTANDVLANQGTFQKVVDLLQDMVNKGDSVAAADTDAINADRCKFVLPSIDTYLGAAGTNLKAVRPTACQGIK